MTGQSSDEVSGAVLCRAGRYDEAVELLTPLRNAMGTTSDLARHYLTLAEHGRGNVPEARRLYTRMASSLKVRAAEHFPLSLAWIEQTHIEQLRRELEALFK